MAIPRLSVENTALFVIDMQEGLLPLINDHERVIAQVIRLMDGAAALGVPMLATEQYPKALGKTIDPIKERLKDAWCLEEKLKFSGFIEPVRDVLAHHHARTILVCGVESHVCVLQTCLDLVAAGYVVAVAMDAIGSRNKGEVEIARMRMLQVGILPVSVESVLFELAHEAGTERFKALLPIIKS